MFTITDSNDVHAVRCRETVNGLEIAIVTEAGTYVFENGQDVVDYLEEGIRDYEKTSTRLDNTRRTAKPVKPAD